MEFDDRNNKLKALQAELSSIELRRKQLMSEIKQLEVGHVLTTPIQARTISRNMNNRSSQQEKVRLERISSIYKVAARFKPVKYIRCWNCLQGQTNCLIQDFFGAGRAAAQ